MTRARRSPAPSVTPGLLGAVAVTTTEVTDRKGALQALGHCKPGLKWVRSLPCDSGHVGQPFAQGVRELLAEDVTVQIVKCWVVAQLCLVGQEQTAVEALRAVAQHQLAVRLSGFLGAAALRGHQHALVCRPYL